MAVKSESLLKITDNAADKASEIMDSQDLDGYGVRIYIQQGGCSGYSYGMQFDDDIDDTDMIVEHNGVKFIVDEHSAQYIEGSTVDFKQSLEASGFDIENPNATSECGCGESFQV